MTWLIKLWEALLVKALFLDEGDRTIREAEKVSEEIRY